MSSSFGKTMADIRKKREQLDPADYQYVCEYYTGPNQDIQDAYGHEEWPEEVPLDNLDKCGHCGTYHFYGVLFKEKLTGEYINIGNSCASKFFIFDSKRAYYQAQAKRAAQKREQKRIAEENARQILDQNPELEKALETNHRIINDIKERLFKYGRISQAQIDLVLRIAQQEAEREPEPEPVPIPVEMDGGRHTFTGTILGYKERESEWGVSWKMLVRDNRGFKVYGGVPDPLHGCRGDEVTFTARLEISKSDPCFGFYSRPTKAKCTKD